ncbi:MAG TPA: SAM-dependent methyltransferase [Acidimicrobiales bacterium]|nr:SAM-dependent methyltransferase [Acidimicrobiales bacterium]
MRDGVASETARRVAAQRLTFRRVATGYGDPAADDRLTRDVAGSTRATTTTMTRYLGARTTFFDMAVVNAVDWGIEQLVVAAAGYDGRAWRYAKPGVHWYEVDHPDTQADKRARVARLGLDTSHVSFVPADFAATDVAAELRATGFDATKPSMITLEGVAIYLEREVLASLLSSFRSLAAVGTRLAISLSIARDGVRARLEHSAFRARVAAVGEPVKTVLARDEVAAFLAATGWRDTGVGSERGRAAGLVVLEPVIP